MAPSAETKTEFDPLYDFSTFSIYNLYNKDITLYINNDAYRIYNNMIKVYLLIGLNLKFLICAPRLALFLPANVLQCLHLKSSSV